jgi:hypothetical protein
MATTPPMLAVSYLGARGISTAVVGEAASRKNSDDSNIVVASISTSPGCSSPEEESSRRNEDCGIGVVSEKSCMELAVVHRAGAAIP